MIRARSLQASAILAGAVMGAVLSATVLTAGCQTPRPSPTPLDTPIPSSPVAIPSPEATWTRTPAPTPTSRPFAEEGPWVLAYSESLLALYDQNGSRRALSAGPRIWDPERDLQRDAGVSSLGWLAVRTAREDHPHEDIALSIFRPPHAAPVRTIPLISDELIAEYRAASADAYGYWRDIDVYQLLINILSRPRWSADGRYVAFGAALDGHSIDIYVYDIQLDVIRRLTDEAEHVVVLGWSPDSRWVVYVEVAAAETSLDNMVTPRPAGYIGLALRAASLDSDERPTLWTLSDSRRFKILAWASSTEFLLGVLDSNGIGVGVSEMSIELPEVGEHHEIGFLRSAADGESRAALVTMPARDQNAGGIYLIRPGESSPILISESYVQFPYSDRANWEERVERFFVQTPAGVIGVDPTGQETQRFEQESCLPELSADGAWLAFGVCPEWSGIIGSGIRLYDLGAVLRVSITDIVVLDIAWWPDTSGFSYVTENGELKYYDLGTDTTVITDTAVPPDLVLIPPSG